MKEPYTLFENNAMLFATRYCYTRNTVLAFSLVHCLIQNWHRLNGWTQSQILSEAYNEAQYNRVLCWQKLFDHASYKPNTKMKTESDTPRTDAETMRDEYDHVDTEFGAFAPSNTVSADFARQLERELNDAIAAATKLTTETK